MVRNVLESKRFTKVVPVDPYEKNLIKKELQHQLIREGVDVKGYNNDKLRELCTNKGLPLK